MSLALGVFYHWLGGLAVASFYIPYRAVRHWSWETYWLVGGFFSWTVAPSLIGALLVPDLYGHIAAALRSSLMWSYFFGALWGHRRNHLGIDHALPRDRHGDGGGSRFLRRLRNSRAAGVCR
jgi:hypothetical protein